MNASRSPASPPDPFWFLPTQEDGSDIGIETFIGSGYPHLEEAYRVAELLFPELGIDGRRRKVSDNIINEFAVGSHSAERRLAAVS